jgi:hypothetical protein
VHNDIGIISQITSTTTTDTITAIVGGINFSSIIGKDSRAAAFRISRVHNIQWWLLITLLILLAIRFSSLVPTSYLSSRSKVLIAAKPTVLPLMKAATSMSPIAFNQSFIV